MFKNMSMNSLTPNRTIEMVADQLRVYPEGQVSKKGFFERRFWMRWCVLMFIVIGMGLKSMAQTTPAAFDLSTGSFTFTSQTATNTTYPTNMQGWANSANNISTAETTAPTADQAMVASGTATTAGISNLGASGFQFLSTSTAPNRKVGSVCVAINTTNRQSVLVSWTAQDMTTSATGTTMGLSMQYRIGTTGAFTDFGSSGLYQTSSSSQAAAQNFSNISLPSACDNQAVVQVRWIYYQIGTTGSARDAVRLDEITIASTAMPACSGTPAPGNTVASVNPVPSGSSTVLSLQNATTGTGVTYQWQSSANGSSWTDIASATSATYTATPASDTYYRCNVTCSGTTTASNSLQVTLTYCASTGTASYYISNFSTSGGVSNINNASAATSGGYADYSSTSSCSQYANYSINYSVANNVSTSLGNGFAIYVDWNNDKDFADAGENVASTNGTYVYSSPWTGSFTVPAGTAAGSYRMRVIDNYSSSTPAACNSGISGETEDYTFTVLALVNCSGTPSPGNTLASVNPVPSGSSTVLSLQNSTTGVGVTYQWQSSADGTNWSNIVSATNNTYTASPTATTYYRCNVTCSNSSQTGTSTAVQVTIAACAPSGTNSNSYYITGVTTTGGVATNISNTGTSYGTTNNGYSNYYNTNSVTTYAGGTVNINVTISTSTYGIAVWVDWNANNVFETSERLYNSGSYVSSLSNVALSIPAGTADGSYRMRILADYGSSSPSACSFTSYLGTIGGEAEDYKLIIANPVISSTSTSLTGFLACAGSVSTAQSIDVSGVNMAGVITVTPPTGFQVSTTSATAGFANSVTLGAAGTISATSVWVRIRANATAGSISGNLVLSATGATSLNVALNGTVYSPSVAPTSITGTTSICNGSSTTLTAVGGTLGTGANYQWGTGSTVGQNALSGETNATLTVSPSSTTTYWVRIENTTSPCTSATSGVTQVVTVTDIPTASISYAGSPFCQSLSTGQSVTLTGTNAYTSGTYSSTSGLSINSGNGDITPSSSTSGTYTVTYTLAAAGGCDAVSTTTSVTIKVPPTTASNSSTASICTDGSTTLTGNTPTNGTGAWTVSGPSSSSSQFSSTTSPTATFTPAGGAGSYVTTWTITYLSCTSTASATITANPLPTAVITNASGVTSICSGTSLAFTSSSSTGNGGTISNYQWYVGGSSISGATSSTYTANMPGTYTLEVTTSDGCADLSSNTVIGGNTSPTAKITPATPSDVCYGTSVTLSATSSVDPDGTINAWQWYNDGVAISGATSSTYSATVSGDYTVKVTSTTTCSNTLAYPINLLVKSLPTIDVTEKIPTWTGAQSTDWFDIANWNSCGIPSATTPVLIPSSGITNFPVINNSTASTYNLTVNNGGSISVASAGILNAYGNVDVQSGASLVNSGTISLVGTGAQTFPGAGTIGSMNILEFNNASGITLNNNITVTNELKPTKGTFALGNYDITLKSTIDRTASVSRVGGTAGNTAGFTYGTGRFIVERYINTGTNIPVTSPAQHAKSWHFLAAPTRGGQSIHSAWMEGATAMADPNPGYGIIIGGWAGVGGGFDLYTPQPVMKTYVPATNTYVGVGNPKTTEIGSDNGYMIFVRSDRRSAQTAVPTTLRTRGTMQVGDIGPITVTKGLYQGIGNPYPSAVDYTNLVNTPGLSKSIYVFDPAISGTRALGGWQTLSYVTGYLATPGGTSLYNTTTSYTTVQSGQAFMVKATAAGNNGANPTITFHESDKVSGSRVTTRGSSPSNNIAAIVMLRSNLMVMNGASMELADGNSAVFDNAYSNVVDEDDAAKSINAGENFGLLRDGSKLAVEARQSIGSEDTLYYDMSNIRQPLTYKLQFVPQNLSTANVSAELIDKFLNTRTPISLADTNYVTFTTSSTVGSTASDRFKLVFKPLAPVPVLFTSIAAKRNTDKTIAVEWRVQNEIDMDRYELERSADGKNFATLYSAVPQVNNGGSAIYPYIDATPLTSDNFYRVKALTIGGRVQYSAIVKVAPLSNTGNIAVYPNPVEGSTMQVVFTNQKAGIYEVQLTNALGQIMFKDKWTLAAGNQTRYIDLNKDRASGVYRLQLTSSNGEVKVIQVNVK